jgi:hypothetical protein
VPLIKLCADVVVHVTTPEARTHPDIATDCIPSVATAFATLPAALIAVFPFAKSSSTTA